MDTFHQLPFSHQVRVNYVHPGAAIWAKETSEEFKKVITKMHILFSVFRCNKCRLQCGLKLQCVNERKSVGIGVIGNACVLCWLQEWLSRTILERPGTGQEVADAVLFLASPSAAYITGTGISACGGRVVAL